MRKTVKSLIVSFFFIFAAAAAFTQAPLGRNEQPWWYTLERGKNQFRNGDYGNALLIFEDARRERRTMYERMEERFIQLLSVYEVRRLGDSLDWVERYANERFYADALAALEELYYRVPKESLNNSASAALAALGRLKEFPEAEYWIGEVYRAEGELGLALSQFRKAHDLSGLFENPGFDTELLYKIAGIHKIRREYNEMERTLLSIVAGDSLWTNADKGDQSITRQAALPDGRKNPPVPYAEASSSFARQAMTRTLEGDKEPARESANRFLSMYRYNNTQIEEAHRLLGFYYAASGRHSRAQEHLMFAFLIQNTIVIEEVMRHEYDFAFTGLEALAAGINRYPLLAAYAEKVEYYKTAYYLGASLYGNGKAAPAQGIWIFLSSQPQAGEWRGRAAGQLRDPHVERAVEMP